MVAKPKCTLKMLTLREIVQNNIYYSNTIDSVSKTTAVSACSGKKNKRNYK